MPEPSKNTQCHSGLLMPDLMTRVNIQDLEKTGNRKRNFSTARKVRHPEEPRDPVRIVDNLTMVWKENQWLTLEWVYRLQEIWNYIESHLHPEIIGWTGVANYDESEKKGDVVIIVSHPLFWQDKQEFDSHGEARKETRRQFARALGIQVGKLIVLGGGGIPTREKWQSRLRPLAELPADVAVMPSHWCETRLFIPVKRGRKAFVEDVIIVDRSDVQIKMSGKHLNMKDAKVLMALLRLMKDKPVEDMVETTLHEFCRATGGRKQAYGSGAVESVLASLNRLDWLRLEVRNKEGRSVYSGNLLLHCWRDEVTLRLKLQFNPFLIRLFENLNFLQWDYIRNLGAAEQWFYMALTKDRSGQTQYRQLLDVYPKYTGNEKFQQNAYRKWVSRVAKPCLKKLKEDGIITHLSITRSPTGGHVASWIVAALAGIEPGSDIRDGFLRVEEKGDL